MDCKARTRLINIAHTHQLSTAHQCPPGSRLGELVPPDEFATEMSNVESRSRLLFPEVADVLHSTAHSPLAWRCRASESATQLACPARN